MTFTQYDIDEAIYQMERDDWHPAIQAKYRAYLHRSHPPYMDAWDWMDSQGTSEIAAICSEYHDRIKQLNPNLIEL
jgi:hypothetical protein